MKGNGSKLKGSFCAVIGVILLTLHKKSSGYQDLGKIIHLITVYACEKVIHSLTKGKLQFPPNKTQDFILQF